MGEHHAVHELHPLAPAGLQHLLQLRHAAGAGLFTNHVLSGRSGSQYPLPPQPRGQRNIDGIHFTRCQQVLVRAECFGGGLHRRFSLTLGNEPAAAFQVAAGHGSHRGIAGKLNRLPILSGYLSSAQNAPTKFALVHKSHSRGLSVAELGSRRSPCRSRSTPSVLSMAAATGSGPRSPRRRRNSRRSHQ